MGKKNHQKKSEKFKKTEFLQISYNGYFNGPRVHILKRKAFVPILGYIRYSEEFYEPELIPNL